MTSKKPTDDDVNVDPMNGNVDSALLIEQVAGLTQALQRERADAVNLRRRHDEESQRLRSQVKAAIIKDLLPIADNLERAIKHVPDELANNDYVKGVQGVIKQFEKTFKEIGVERIKTVGEPFDPELHDAVSAEEGGDGTEIVSEELQSGYKIGDDVVRHAMVRVKS